MPTVFNIKLTSYNKSQLFEFIESRIIDRIPSFIVTPNLHFARKANSSTAFRLVLEQADVRLCDSAILSALLKLKGDPVPQRLPGSDITVALISLARKKKWRIFLFGSDGGTLLKIREMFPDTMCGFICPPVHPRLWELPCNDQYIRDIQQAAPDILFVGLGAQKQELWTHKYYKQLRVPVTLCIGASLDFVGGRIRRAPPAVTKMGLEWLWRLCMEPKRLLGRYFQDAIFLAVHLPHELLKTRVNK